ncbi:hypothetical protein BH10PSE12_BH10PSE12_35080 [soil metagenome]
MYDFLDRRVAELDPGGRLLIWAMRLWMEAWGERRCPPARLRSTFRQWRVLPALPHFHMAMMLLARDGRETLPFAPCNCGRVSEGEALMLSLVRAAQDVPGRDLSGGDLETTLALVVTSESVQAMRAALRALTVPLAESGLIPQMPGIPSLSNGAAEE